MKRSLFERLSGGGSSSAGASFDPFDDEAPVAPPPVPRGGKEKESLVRTTAREKMPEEDPGAGQLPVDVHQTPSDIIIRAFVAGVRPDELSISIARDMVEIAGSRMERDQVSTPDYFSRELFWGSFSRTILLPQEVDADNASASARDGLLTLILPKLDRAKQTKLRVKAG